jgi:hypothetical protein
VKSQPCPAQIAGVPITVSDDEMLAGFLEPASSDSPGIVKPVRTVDGIEVGVSGGRDMVNPSGSGPFDAVPLAIGAATSAATATTWRFSCRIVPGRRSEVMGDMWAVVLGGAGD